MKWLKNLIGDSLGFAKCSACQDSFRWKYTQTVMEDDDNNGLFALCKECFFKLPINEVIFWYKHLLQQQMSSSPLDIPYQEGSKRFEFIKKEIERLRSEMK